MLPFMMGGDKKIASMIMAKPEVKEVSDNETDYSAGKEAAAQDIADAIERKDLKLLLSGLEDLISMCIDESESKEDEPEESETDSKPVDASQSGNWK